jgi:hypothetical protein
MKIILTKWKTLSLTYNQHSWYCVLQNRPDLNVANIGLLLRTVIRHHLDQSLHCHKGTTAWSDRGIVHLAYMSASELGRSKSHYSYIIVIVSIGASVSQSICSSESDQQVPIREYTPSLPGTEVKSSERHSSPIVIIRQKTESRPSGVSTSRKHCRPQILWGPKERDYKKTRLEMECIYVFQLRDFQRADKLSRARWDVGATTRWMRFTKCILGRQSLKRVAIPEKEFHLGVTPFHFPSL